MACGPSLVRADCCVLFRAERLLQAKRLAKMREAEEKQAADVAGMSRTEKMELVLDMLRSDRKPHKVDDLSAALHFVCI